LATRKISDLTLLTDVSSSDTLLLLDNSDPTDRNKRTNVGSIFKSVPSGTATDPGFQFELKTNTGVYSTTQGQIGIALGDSKLNLQKVGTSLVVAAQDSVDSNLDFTLQAQGTGLIRFASPIAITDTLFALPNTSDITKRINFSAAQIAPGTTRTFVFPDPGQTDTVVTQTATQTLTNKTFSNASFTGTTSILNITVTGNTTLGDDSADSFTVNAASQFAAAATFQNAVQINSTLGVTGDTSLSGHLSLLDNKQLRIGTGSDLVARQDGTQSFITNNTGSLFVEAESITIRSITGSEKYFAATLNGGAELYYNNIKTFETTATGATLTGALSTTGNVTATGDVSGANADFSQNLIVDGGAWIGANNTYKLGVGRAATTYNLEVAGDIYFEGDTLIGGSAPGDGFVIQKREAAINFDVRDNLGNVQIRVDTIGRLGIGKTPGDYLDVEGDGNIDGDFTVSVTDALNDLGGKIYARKIILTDPVTSQTTTIDATSSGSGGGVSRAKVFFHAYS